MNIKEKLKEITDRMSKEDKDLQQKIKTLKIQQGKVLLAFIEAYLAIVSKDRNEQYVIDFCDTLNKLSITY